MTGGLLDTSVLIARDVTGESLPSTAAISVVTLGELHAGILLATSERVRRHRRARLAAVRAVFEAIVVDEAIAEGYGRILAVARSGRRTVKATDILIVATADVHRRTLYTRDASQARLAQAADVAVVAL